MWLAGRRLVVIDSPCLDAADTVVNAEHFGRPGAASEAWRARNLRNACWISAVRRDVAAVEYVGALAGHSDLGQAHAVHLPDHRDAARSDAVLADRSRSRAIQIFVPASTREG